jgi:hypothetical protein
VSATSSRATEEKEAIRLQVIRVEKAKHDMEIALLIQEGERAKAEML